MEKISLYERRRRLIAVLYERQTDTVGNLAFEFDVSSHTIRHDIRVLELEYPIYTKVGAGGGVFILNSSRLQQRWLTVHQRELLMCARWQVCWLTHRQVLHWIFTPMRLTRTSARHRKSWERRLGYEKN